MGYGITKALFGELLDFDRALFRSLHSSGEQLWDGLTESFDSYWKCMENSFHHQSISCMKCSSCKLLLLEVQLCRCLMGDPGKLPLLLVHSSSSVPAVHLVTTRRSEPWIQSADCSLARDFTWCLEQSNSDFHDIKETREFSSFAHFLTSSQTNASVSVRLRGHSSALLGAVRTRCPVLFIWGKNWWVSNHWSFLLSSLLCRHLGNSAVFYLQSLVFHLSLHRGKHFIISINTPVTVTPPQARPGNVFLPSTSLHTVGNPPSRTLHMALSWNYLLF